MMKCFRARIEGQDHPAVVYADSYTAAMKVLVENNVVGVTSLDEEKDLVVAVYVQATTSVPDIPIFNKGSIQIDIKDKEKEKRRPTSKRFYGLLPEQVEQGRKIQWRTAKDAEQNLSGTVNVGIAGISITNGGRYMVSYGQTHLGTYDSLDEAKKTWDEARVLDQGWAAKTWFPLDNYMTELEKFEARVKETPPSAPTPPLSAPNVA